MDTKLICPTLSVVLVKTIKALCEINIKYDQKLEITGSLHVRSDGQNVLTCLLDEETIKGQHDAARIAELAARLSMAAAAFPYLQIAPASISHQQQVAEALLSTMQASGGGVADPQHILNSPGQQIAIVDHRTMHDVSSAGGGCAVANQPVYLHHHHHGRLVETAVEAAMQEEARQAVASLRQHGEQQDEPANHHQTNAAVVAVTMAQQHHHQQPQQQQQHRKQKHSEIAKILGTNRQLNTGGGGALNAIAGLQIYQTDMAAIGGQPVPNHVKLPDIQTLAHSLPKYPSNKSKASSSSNGAMPPMLSVVTAKEEAAMLTFSPPLSDPSATSPMPTLDPMISVNVEVQSEVDAEGNIVQRKKFQCMFCGIFLSTKCYLVRMILSYNGILFNCLNLLKMFVIIHMLPFQIRFKVLYFAVS